MYVGDVVEDEVVDVGLVMFVVDILFVFGMFFYFWILDWIVFNLEMWGYSF